MALNVKNDKSVVSHAIVTTFNNFSRIGFYAESKTKRSGET